MIRWDKSPNFPNARFTGPSCLVFVPGGRRINKIKVCWVCGKHAGKNTNLGYPVCDFHDYTRQRILNQIREFGECVKG